MPAIDPIQEAQDKADAEKVAATRMAARIQASRDQCHLIHLAAASGKVALVKRQTALDIDVNRMTTVDEYTPLHIAVSLDHMSVAAFLLSRVRTIDVDRTDRYGSTALHHCATNNTAAIAKLLIETGGAKVDLLNRAGR